MRAGPLREVVTIQSATEALDSYGQPVKTWSTLATVRAQVRPVSASESEQGGKTEPRAIFVFTIRYLSTVSERNRIVWNGNNYDIEEIIDLNARNKTMRLRAFKNV